jgi:hypothetical protein
MRRQCASCARQAKADAARRLAEQAYPDRAARHVFVKCFRRGFRPPVKQRRARGLDAVPRPAAAQPRAVGASRRCVSPAASRCRAAPRGDLLGRAADRPGAEQVGQRGQQRAGAPTKPRRSRPVRRTCRPSAARSGPAAGMRGHAQFRRRVAEGFVDHQPAAARGQLVRPASSTFRRHGRAGRVVRIADHHDVAGATAASSSAYELAQAWPWRPQ